MTGVPVDVAGSFDGVVQDCERAWLQGGVGRLTSADRLTEVAKALATIAANRDTKALVALIVDVSTPTSSRVNAPTGLARNSTPPQHVAMLDPVLCLMATVVLEESHPAAGDLPTRMLELLRQWTLEGQGQGQGELKRAEVAGSRMTRLVGWLRRESVDSPEEPTAAVRARQCLARIDRDVQQGGLLAGIQSPAASLRLSLVGPAIPALVLLQCAMRAPAARAAAGMSAAA